RQLLQLGLLAGASAGVRSAGAAPGSGGAGSAPPSPPTTPFRAPLPIQPIATAVPSLSPAPAADPVAGEAARETHQFWNELLPQKLYDVRIAELHHRFHPELPSSTVWGFEGSSPGPTFHARYGEPIVVRFRNQLPSNHVGFGIPQVTIHLH